MPQRKAQMLWGVDPEVNAEKTKYVFKSHHWNAEKKHNIEIGHKSFIRVQILDCIHREIKSRLNLGNAYYS
jgi:hypothetical protein